MRLQKKFHHKLKFLSLEKINKLKLLILILLFLGCFFRLYNLNWDYGFTFHPDERNIAAAVSRINFFENLDPGFFAYGGSSIYLYKVTGEYLNFISNSPNWTLDWGLINVIGRHYSALFSCISIPFVFFLARKLFSKKTAYLASVLFAFFPSSIQNAHYATTESALTLLILIITLLSIKIYEEKRLLHFILCGLVIGIAFATKTSAFTFVSPFFTVVLLLILENRKRFFYIFANSLLALGYALVAFLSLSPFTLLNWIKFMESMNYEYGVVRGTLDVVYTLQFTNTPIFLYQLSNLIWQMGPTAILLIPALLAIILSFTKKNYARYLIFLSFPVLYFISIGTWHTKFIRYMIPLLPFFAIMISYLLYDFIAKFPKIRWILVIAFTTVTFLWAFAFTQVYRQPQTRIKASEWIFENIPSGSKIKTEHWDDGLPVPLPNQNTAIYDRTELTIYEPDNEEKLEYYGRELSQTDYIIINSRRLYGTLIRLTDKYPLTSKYYTKLFGGSLGYEKVAEFTSYPNLFGFTINDDLSEETFQVYDHPKVMIFKNVKKLTNEEIIERLKK